jgi:DNA polymerase III subunit epsilon
MLSLTRPIVFFDLETTGVNTQTDRIVEFAAIRKEPDGTTTEVSWLINPCMPIPKESSAIHGITDDMVQKEKTLGERSAELSTLFNGADIGGYNVAQFDLPVLRAECERIGLSVDFSHARIVDPMIIFKIKEPRTLAAAHEMYCGTPMEHAHEALADIRATVAVLDGQFSRYADLPRDTDGLHAFCFPRHENAYDPESKIISDNGVLRINFGKNKGKALADLATTDPGYLQWVLKGDFSDMVKDAVRSVLR